ncbi:unnamed protein product [Spirodela intermedia]|uniref:Alpha/beta hydrolase fold-3 domain-containing protein n=1 Tax=Spirodela intermedia TaxID=51605 RepID=A0A7I8K6G6_SPIIN|nr:unnamed protein product [Spirodela intermedia]
MAAVPPMDPYDLLRASLNPDGTLNRSNLLRLLPPGGAASSTAAAAVAVEKVPLNPSHGTHLWIFLPGCDPAAPPLPVVFYVPGGGFIIFNAEIGPFLSSCRRFAGELPAVVVALQHRLAPEHRLPAAHDDAVAALLWLRHQAAAAADQAAPPPWLSGRRADFSRCFLLGSSSGGNIVYHALHRLLAEGEEDLRPLEIRGVVFNEPFFGGAARTPSETSTDLPINDLLWELALPEGTDRDHPFCNPLLRHHHWRRRRWLPRCLIRCYLGDPLIDRLRALAAELRHQAAKLVTLFDADGFHGIELYDPSKFQSLIDDLKLFISSSSSSSPPPPAAAAAAAAEEEEEKEHASGGRF